MEKNDTLDTVYDMSALLSSIITISIQAMSDGEQDARKNSDLCYGIRCLAEQAMHKTDELENSIMTTNRLLDEMRTALAEGGV